MSVTEALFNEPETASADARTVGLDAAPEEAFSQGASEVFLTLSDAQQEEQDAWTAFKAAEKEMFATPIGQQTARLNSEWYQKQKLTEAIQTTQKLGLIVATGCSRRAVPCGQADHLRQCLAAGAKPTANEAN